MNIVCVIPSERLLDLSQFVCLSSITAWVHYCGHWLSHERDLTQNIQDLCLTDNEHIDATELSLINVCIDFAWISKV